MGIKIKTNENQLTFPPGIFLNKGKSLNVIQIGSIGFDEKFIQTLPTSNPNCALDFVKS